MLRVFLLLGLCVGFVSGHTSADDSAPALPVREVTVFKDGHAMLLRHGLAKTSDDGSVSIDNLPRPVMGTFWAYCDEPGAAMKSIALAKRTTESTKRAASHAEYIQANVGKRVRVTIDEETILGEIARVTDTTVMLQTDEGFRLLLIEKVTDIAFDERPSDELGVSKTQKTVLEMRLDWDGNQKPQARIGMTYLQKGIRWIPSYKVSLGADGNAKVSLQATLINEMIDLENTSVNLVVGVPSFQFKHTFDPIAGLDRESNQVQLSGFFQEATQTAYGMSNSMMTQVSRMGDHRGRQVAQPSEMDEIEQDPSNPGELSLFHLPSVTMKSGERQIHTLGTWTVPFEEIYKLEVDSIPPTEFQQYSNVRAHELMRLMNRPKVHRYVRLSNKTDAPLTTGPAILFDEAKGMVLAQSMMTYTAIGGRVDLEVTAAVDIQVRQEDNATGRTAKAIRHNGEDYYRVDVASSVHLTNYRDKPLKIEVVRRVLGEVDEVSKGGEAVTPMFHERLKYRPSWWYAYNWPYWWNYLNPIQSGRWQVELAAGESKSVTVNWHYFWR